MFFDQKLLKKLSPSFIDFKKILAKRTDYDWLIVCVTEFLSKSVPPGQSMMYEDEILQIPFLMCKSLIDFTLGLIYQSNIFEVIGLPQSSSILDSILTHH